MDSNTHSMEPAADLTGRLTGASADQPDGLAALTAAVDLLDAEDVSGLPVPVRAERVLALRRLMDRQEGHWLAELAGVDACGAAGAEQGLQAPSTASWLRARLRMSAGAASNAVRTARALFRGPLTQTGQALIAGELTPAHATVLAAGTHQLPAHLTAEAEPVLLEAARRLDPGRLRRALDHLRLVADPDGATSQSERRHQQRGLWLTSTLDGMVAVDGLLESEAGQTLITALEPLARPHGAADDRSGGQRRTDALCELARRSLEGGRLPQTGGVRPQLTVIVDLDSLTGHPGSGAVGGAIDSGVLDPEACRRLACDSAVTRALVTRQPIHHHGHANPSSRDAPNGRVDRSGHPGHDPTGPLGGHAQAGGHHDHQASGDDHQDPGGDGSFSAQLQAAARRLPPVLGGAPSQPLDVGRTSRVVTPSQRHALAVRDGGCVFPGCDRPLAWCEAHHLWHWLHGGPTDLDNLALLCRAHHRAVHEGGWQLTRAPTGDSPPPHRIDNTDDDILPPLEPAEQAGHRPLPPCQASEWRPRSATATVPGGCMGPELP